MSRPHSYRKYTKEFKSEAVRLSLDSDKPVKQLAQELGITEKVLYRRRSKQAHAGSDAFRGNGRRTASDEEIVRLQREVALLTMERDILKKAAAWFAKQQL